MDDTEARRIIRESRERAQQERAAEAARLGNRGYMMAKPKGVAPTPRTVFPSSRPPVTEAVTASAQRRPRDEEAGGTEFGGAQYDDEVAETMEEVGLRVPETKAFHSFALIMKTLRQYPLVTQREMVGLIMEMLLKEG